MFICLYNYMAYAMPGLGSMFLLFRSHCLFNFFYFYFVYLNRYKTLRSYDLYRSGHIHSMVFLPMADASCCALKGKCNPSWDTSGKVYDCIVLFHDDASDPVGSNCTCTAGQGEGCTHVAALLFAMEDFTSLGNRATNSHYIIYIYNM